MKKILSFLLLTVMLLTATFTGVTVSAEGEALDAVIWSPVEIKLESTKEYKNPYLDVELTAVFTHTDGTTITLPGFWYEKNTFAVRFSPTKTGTWSYKITSNDENASLTKEGTINAKENPSDNMLAQHGFIKTDKSSNYFMYDDGTPFFWLGDTHWQAPNYEQTNVCNYPGCNCYNQFKHEVDNRKAKGFTVYQTYFDSSSSDGGGQQGKIPSIWEEKLVLPSSEVFNNKIDYMFSYLNEQDFSIALGFGVHSSTARAATLEQMKPFLRYCVGRYACYSIMWITAQEITRTEPAKDANLTVMDFWMLVADYVYELDGYKHPGSAHMDVIEYADVRSFRLDAAEWHTYWESQGGHGLRMLSTKNRYYGYCATGKPVIEGEYSYEDINCGGFVGYDDARIGAWNAMVNGCAGYTYGVTGIWANCYSTENNVGWFNGFTSYNYEPWYMGLDKPGSFDMGYMKNFFLNIPNWTQLKARYSDTKYADYLKDDKKFLMSKDDASTFVAYFINDDTETGTIYNVDAAKTYKAMWYNPTTGKYLAIEDGITGKSEYQVPQKPDIKDWVFILTAEEIANCMFEKPYVKPEKSENVGNIITPYEVKAIGGNSYEASRLVNNTKYLYDLDGKNAWEPFADRVTQTIIYDLGVPYDVTQINLVPATDTVLPKYRIEGSLDNKNWTIIVNTGIHDQTMSADGTYYQEALTGSYRYIKILLLNAVSTNLSKAGDIEYKTTINSHTNTQDPHVYSHTAIAEISVFGNKTNIDDLVNSTVDTPQNNEGNASVPTENKLTFDLIPIIITGAAALVLIIVAFIATKKKKEN